MGLVLHHQSRTHAIPLRSIQDLDFSLFRKSRTIFRQVSSIQDRRSCCSVLNITSHVSSPSQCTWYWVTFLPVPERPGSLKRAFAIYSVRGAPYGDKRNSPHPHKVRMCGASFRIVCKSNEHITIGQEDVIFSGVKEKGVCNIELQSNDHKNHEFGIQAWQFQLPAEIIRLVDRIPHLLFIVVSSTFYRYVQSFVWSLWHLYILHIMC